MRSEEQEIKPCPFCGKSFGIVVQAVQICGEEIEDDQRSGFSAVVCDASKPKKPEENGCGGMGGFFPTEEEAIAAWNARVRATDAGEAEAVDCGEYGHAEGACGNAQCSPRRLTDAQIDKIRFAIPTKAVTQRDFELARAIEAALSPTPSDNRQQYAKEGESYVEGVNVERLAQALRALGMRSWDSLEEAPTVMSDAVNRLTRNVIKYVLTPPPATPAVAVQAEPAPWQLLEAAKTVDIRNAMSEPLHINSTSLLLLYRAFRALSAHPKPAAPEWDDNPDGIGPGQASGPRMNRHTGQWEE